MLAVVDSSDQGLVILKIVLKDVEEIDIRNYNMYSNLKPESDWVILRICSLENFNKSYIGMDSLNQCILKDQLLDLKLDTSSDKFPLVT